MESRAFLPMSFGEICRGDGDFSVEHDRLIIRSIDCAWSPLKWSLSLFTANFHPHVIKDLE